MGVLSVIVCPARGVDKMRVPPDWRQSLADGRLLLASPFDGGRKRATQETARKRSEFVASLADQVLVIRAAPGSRTLALCKQLIISGKTVITFDSPHNAYLFARGAQAQPGVNP